MIKITKDLILSIREMLERHLDVLEIAHRMGMDPSDVQMIIQIIKELV